MCYRSVTSANRFKCTCMLKPYCNHYRTPIINIFLSRFKNIIYSALRDAHYDINVYVIIIIFFFTYIVLQQRVTLNLCKIIN